MYMYYKVIYAVLHFLLVTMFVPVMIIHLLTSQGTIIIMSGVYGSLSMAFPAPELVRT